MGSLLDPQKLRPWLALGAETQTPLQLPSWLQTSAFRLLSH